MMMKADAPNIIPDQSISKSICNYGYYRIQTLDVRKEGFLVFRINLDIQIFHPGLMNRQVLDVPFCPYMPRYPVDLAYVHCGLSATA